MDGFGKVLGVCDSCCVDAAAIASRLGMLELAGADSQRDGRALQSRVIRPNADVILDRFYDSLIDIEAFREILGRHSEPERLKRTQRHYLLSLGVDFDQPLYFEERLRIGSVHHRIGVPQHLYQSSFQALQFLLIQHIPMPLRRDEAVFQGMIHFILKITALDMSLAVESYCANRLDGLERSLEIERDEKERLNHLATTDSLTQLHNHAYSRHLLADALRRALIDGSPLCVIMADLDHFKEINDLHGHLIGDQVLRIAAARMIACARSGDEICRYGGEEFMFILRDTGAEEGQEIAERMRIHINSDTIRGRHENISLTLSLGIAEAHNGDSVNSLIDRADAALYAAKLAGRDCVRSESDAS